MLIDFLHRSFLGSARDEGKIPPSRTARVGRAWRTLHGGLGLGARGALVILRDPLFFERYRLFYRQHVLRFDDCGLRSRGETTSTQRYGLRQWLRRRGNHSNRLGVGAILRAGVALDLSSRWGVVDFIFAPVVECTRSPRARHRAIFIICGVAGYG